MIYETWYLAHSSVRMSSCANKNNMAAENNHLDMTLLYIHDITNVNSRVYDIGHTNDTMMRNFSEVENDTKTWEE